MNSTVFIPKRINVGFQQRSDTYTGRLAFVIYYDEKGKLRQETSWDGWRDKKIPNQEFNNTPVSGFVLNKKVGGHSTGWNHRQTYVRIYDPRNFEFEITVPNLLYILENTNSIKGKGLEGEFIYGWDGKDLVLIPTDSPDYIELNNYNELIQARSFIQAKELVVGAEYLTKKNERYIYIGKFDYWEQEMARFYTESNSSCYYYYGRGGKETGWYLGYKTENKINIDDTWDVENDNSYKYANKGKYFYFYDTQRNEFVYMDKISQKLIKVLDNACCFNYAELFDKLETEPHYSPIDSTKTKYIPISYENFVDILESNRRDYTDNDGTAHTWYSEITLYDGERYNYKLSFDVYKTHKWTYCKQHHNASENIAESTEAMYNEIKPVFKDMYLQNGKFYERRGDKNNEKR